MSVLLRIVTASLVWAAVAVVVGLFLGAVVHLADERSLIGCPDAEDQ
ncbi:hypothetical protein [Pseudonocardia sp.]|nr:hypothetical protein [Pseudonocardia sp.]MCW2721358.1 hypothetical protein [Pseudonocardia sp.]